MYKRQAMPCAWRISPPGCRSPWRARPLRASPMTVSYTHLDVYKRQEQVSRQIEQAGSVVQQLETDSASISMVLDVIRGIAEQTNLLALNAAIEAARAGEQGLSLIHISRWRP